MIEVFGEETIEQTGPVWGLDHEGELRGQYRPSGHPGVSLFSHLLICFVKSNVAISCGMEQETSTTLGSPRSN